MTTANKTARRSNQQTDTPPHETTGLRNVDVPQVFRSTFRIYLSRAPLTLSKYSSASSAFRFFSASSRRSLTWPDGDYHDGGDGDGGGDGCGGDGDHDDNHDHGDNDDGDDHDGQADGWRKGWGCCQCFGPQGESENRTAAESSSC